MMPELELPIAPSWYMSNSGRPWELRENNTWYFNNIPMTLEEAHEAVPFTRLDERYVTASEALDRAAEVLHEVTTTPAQDEAVDAAVSKVKPEFDELFHE